MTLNGYVVRGSFVSALGGLLFGYDIAAISGTTSQLTQVFGLSKPELGLTMSSALAGTVIGAMLAGIPAERLGRRDSLRVLAVFYLIAALGEAFVAKWDLLIALRMLGGLGIGGFSVITPMYIAEISPPEWRGRLVGLFQINIVVGLLVGYLSNFLITCASLGSVEWHWKLGVIALPAAVLFVMLFAIGRSPRWLAARNRLDEARRELRLAGVSDVEAELRDIVSSIHLRRETSSESVLGRRYRKPLFLALGVAIFNQLSGNSAVLFYLNDIFASAGFNSVSASAQAIYVGITEVVATLLAMAVIDKLGRIKLLLVGAVGMTVCLAAIAFIFQTGAHTNFLLPALVIFIVSFAISQGSVVWVYLGEIFPNKVRASGQSLASGVNWISNVLVTFSFPILAAHYRARCFYFFSAMMALQFVLVLLFFPETKGLSLEGLQRRLGIK